MTLGQAKTALEDAGLGLGSPTQGPSNDFDVGLIFQQDPAAGDAVPQGTLVDVVVSTGPEMVAVPDVSTQCLSIGGARKALKAVGLALVLSPDTAPANPACPNLSRIVAQDPAAGNQVQFGSSVTVFQGADVLPVAVTMWFATEDFTPDERAVLEPHFTNLEGPIFALVNLPEAVKGAMFARYSRTTKSLRRLFLDEFAEDIDGGGELTSMGRARAERLYESVFVEYGDDSVAQLGGVHLACEQSSQLLAKALEWGRLAAYLEQSTRYMRYDDRPGGRWRATVPPELEGAPLARSLCGVPR